MIRRPPRSPLFPSPTLSRSAARREPRHGGQDQRQGEILLLLPHPLVVEQLRRGENRLPLGWAGAHHPVPDPDRQADRKSTRLNSSHSQISYAVFCLKKKKKK